MSTAFQNLDKLSSSLYDDLVTKAELEIQKMNQEAEKERDKLLNDARLKADSYFKEEERRLKQIKESQEAELKQAALSLKQRLKDDIIHLIQSQWINPNIKKSLEDPKLIQSLILGFAEQIKGGNYQLQVPSENELEWKIFVKDKLTDLEIIKSDNVKLKLINVDDGFQLSFGEEEFKALFQEFLTEDLAIMLFAND